MDYTLQEISTLIQGSELLGEREVRVTHVVYDSRKVVKPSSGLFIAIKGEVHNGHNYIVEAYEKGIRCFLVSECQELPLDASQIVVADTMDALHLVAQHHRTKLKYPIVGVTGSNGKTIVKEWLSSMLIASGWRVQKSPKSYNSQLGVALSVLDFNLEADIGIVEAGISQVGEMEKLERMILPDIGVFTNLGSAHSVGFESDEEKFLEKIKLFAHAKKVIATAEYNIPNYHIAIGGDYLIERKGKSLRVNQDLFLIPFEDEVSVQNMTFCIVTALELGLFSAEINESISQLSQVKMRLEVKSGVNNCHIIDDSYNNDLVGIQTAFEFLNQQHFNHERTLVLSDILYADKKVYQEVHQLIKEYSFKKVFLIGEKITALVEKNKEYFHYKTLNEFLESVSADQFKDEVILVKGARAYGLEKVVSMIQRKLHRTTLEVNLNAIAHNLNVYRARLKPSTKVMAMVKAFSYGAGDAEVAQLLEFQKVDYLAVAYADEGIKLRASGVSLPIMVMNAPASDVYELNKYNLEPEVFTLTQLSEMAETGLRLKVHLKLDTGMHRLGFEDDEISRLLKLLQENPQLKVVSAFTHLSGTDEAKFDKFTIEQVARYNKMIFALEEVISEPFLKHILNSAGITRFDEYQYDMVRLGIGLYGFGATTTIQNELQNVGTLKTIVSQVKEVKEGETIGYSRKGEVTTVKRIATISIGYADGFDRRFSNGVGEVLIKHKRFPVIGNVCMDMCMVDITGDERIKAGDEVIVYGEQNDVKKIAKSINTIPYELLTSIGERVKRIYYLEE